MHSRPRSYWKKYIRFAWRVLIGIQSVRCVCQLRMWYKTGIANAGVDSLCSRSLLMLLLFLSLITCRLMPCFAICKLLLLSLLEWDVKPCSTNQPYYYYSISSRGVLSSNTTDYIHILILSRASIPMGQGGHVPPANILTGGTSSRMSPQYF